MDIDNIKLTLNQTSIDILKIIISLLMFSVALDLKTKDFKSLISTRKPLYLGIFIFYIALPLLTMFLIHFLNLRASFALGLIMLTVCPTGNIANLMTMLGRGNVALTVGLSSIVNLTSIITMPILMSFMVQNSHFSKELNTAISLDIYEIFTSVFILLGIPICFGMICNKLWPIQSFKIHQIFKKISTIFLLLFIVIGLIANFNHFIQYFNSIFYLTLTFVISSVALTLILNKIFRLNTKDSLSLMFSSCHKNSALGLSISLQNFQHLGGMSLFLAFASIAQIFLGLILTKFLNFDFIKKRL